MQQSLLRREREDAYIALHDNEERFREVVENIEEVFWMTSINKDRMHFISRAYEKVWGRTCASLYSNPMAWLDAIHPDDRARVSATATAKQTSNDYVEEYRIVRPDGSIRWISDRAFPVRNAAGEIYRVAGVATDITERKDAEAALRKSEDQLHQAQKMDAIGQLAGGVAHDFNNQLSVILGYANILSQQITQPNLRKFAENICIAARRSADLTQKLLVFARKGQTQTAPVDLHKILGETLEMLERTVDKRIVLRQDLQADSAVVTGSASQLQNALLNLGVNARDAMPDGGELTYHSAIDTLDAAFCSAQPQAIAPGQYLKISVSDSGTGMSDEVKQHLFEPFFTTKPIGKGTGLGLASVYGTVKQHGGTLTVDSTLGRGTRFTIYLPLADQSGVQAASETAVIQTVKPLRILAVEDEEILRTMLVYMLSTCDHEVQEAEDGKVAVAFYRSNWREIDLVILDMVMPEMNGHDTFLAMKKINPDIKAILATGYSLNSEVQAILDDGVKDFLQKPFEPAQLQNAIAKVMKQ